MPAAAHTSWDWHQLANLGEQLRSENSLSAQCDQIINMTSQLMNGVADVWLQEKIFRLPDWGNKSTFPAQPKLEAMKLAIKQGKLIVKNSKTKNSASSGVYACVPLTDAGVTLGALYVSRKKGTAFSAEELNLLQGIAQIVSVSLLAAHRVAVEQFRLRQLNLVRAVSTQIANAQDLDELAKQVTKLIQKTFHYYYVALFTLKQNFQSLRFRASAVASRKGKKKANIALEVDIGQGLIGEVAQTGETIVCDNVQKDPRFRFIDSLPETKSEVVIPLKIDNQVVGVLDVQSDRLRAFHHNDLLILHSLADNIARAVEGAYLYSNLRRRAEQMTLVSEVSKSVTSTLDLSELMRDAANLIHTKFKYPYVSLFTVHPIRRLISYQAGSGRKSKQLEGYSISLDDTMGIMPWVAQTGKAILANDVTKDKRYVPSPLPPQNTKSELCVPLLFNDKVVGLLDIQSDKLNAFTEDDQIMFEAVADTIAAAIRNADLYRSEQWRRQVADSLREVAGLVSSNVGEDEVLGTILTELDRNLPVDISAIWLLDNDELRLSAVHGIDAMELEAACIANPESAYSMAEAMLSDEPVIRKPDDPIWPGGLTAGYDKNYSSIVAPLRVGDRQLGLLALAHHTSGRYGHESQAMVATFANYASVAIENARLFDSAQEQAYASAALLQVAQTVVSANDLDEVLNSIVRIMPILVGVQRVALYRWDSLSEKLTASQEYGFSDDDEKILTEKEVTLDAFPLLGITLQENRLVTHTLDVEAKPKDWVQIQLETSSEADMLNAEKVLIAVPLSIKNDLFGVMLIEEVEHGQKFRSRRIEIIQGIAHQIALAIQNDLLQQEMVVRERLETEVQLARQIQQTFIPSVLPTHPNWQIATRWRTARQVGGDFYDLIELPNNKLGIFIADVADKGMPAALFMALTRTLIRAAVLETNSPAEVLKRVNDQLLPDTQQGMFVTAVYGELDVETGIFTYVNAGHNPPYVLKANGDLEKLTRTAIALGVMEDSKVEQKTISFDVGDSLLLYTDGLTEAFSSAGELFGEARLMDTLKTLQNKFASEMIEEIESCLNDFIEANPLGDDLTMLAIRRV